MKFRFLLIVLVLLVAGHAVAQISVIGSGTSPSSIQQGVENAVQDFLSNSLIGWLQKGLHFLASLLLDILFDFYLLIGAILIPIPDYSIRQTFMALSQDPAGTQNAIQCVHNILFASGSVGVFLLFVLVVANAGEMASGFSARQMGWGILLRLAIPAVLIYSWPSLFSAMASFFTSLSYVIYHQNTIQSSGAFSGLTNLSVNASGYLSSSGSANNYSNTQTILEWIAYIWSFVKGCAVLACVVGMIRSGMKLAGGDPKALKMFLGCVFGLIFIVTVPYAYSLLVKSGVENIGTSNSSYYNLQGLWGPSLAVPQEQQTPSSPTSTSPISQTGETLTAIYLDILASIMKIIVAIWGITICFGVIFTKFDQIFSLLVLFFLGPIFCGMAGHPATGHITYAALKLLLRFMLNSVIWTFCLVGLYIVPYLTFGGSVIGSQTVLSGFAILAGLRLIQKSDEFAALFTTWQGGNQGQAVGSWGGFMGDVRSGFSSVADRFSGGPGGGSGGKGGEGGSGSSAMGAAGKGLGAAVGSAIPGVGTMAGAAVGEKVGSTINNFVGGGAEGGPAGGTSKVTDFLNNTQNQGPGPFSAPKGNVSGPSGPGGI